MTDTDRPEIGATVDAGGVKTDRLVGDFLAGDAG